jgi:hypothetical protein
MSSSYVIINGVGYATPKAVDLNVFPNGIDPSDSYWADSEAVEAEEK